MNRRLVATLACRANGTRLYGKPLQSLLGEIRIIDQIIAAIHRFPFIDDLILAIAEGKANMAFVDIADEDGCDYMIGHPTDVLLRLVEAGRQSQASDILRITTEDPFFDYSMLETAWQEHLRDDNEITVLDHVPQGTGFEIYKLSALERSHRDGEPSDRSEFVSNYARFNQALFRLRILEPEPTCMRRDLRLTVDNPEDLILCRAVYAEFKELAPLVPLSRIIAFLDGRPDLTTLVAPFVSTVPRWDGQPQREHVPTNHS